MSYVFIGGIPASGKSYLTKKLAEKYGYKTFEDFNLAKEELLNLLRK